MRRVCGDMSEQEEIYQAIQNATGKTYTEKEMRDILSLNKQQNRSDDMKYCKSCQREVKPVKKFSWPIFILGALLFGVGAIVYLLYYWLLKSKQCPICGRKL